MKRRDMIRWINEELDVLQEAMKAVPPDSDSYKKMQERYDKYVAILEKLDAKKSVWVGIKDAMDLVIRFLGTLAVPVFLGLLAYNGDKELTPVNGRPWNLMGKRFDK